MSQQQGASSLAQHLRGLTQELTELESLGLLNDTGTNLLSLCRKMTPTQSTVGSMVKEWETELKEVERKLISDMCMYPRRYAGVERPQDLLRPYLVRNTQSPSPGQNTVSQKDTLYSMTHGCNGGCGAYCRCI